MAAPGFNFEGILLIDKPSGPTSHDVVNVIRRRLKMKRVGHAGTLDPTATGLLIIMVGKATKVSQYLMSLDKVYEGTMKLGQATESHDIEGELIEEKPVPEFSEEEIRKFLEESVGDQYQVPPMFSAKKVGGVPLYRLARKGKVIEREPRFIRISSIDLLGLDLPHVNFRISCSKGTYVRTFAHDLGQKMGCAAHLANLRRISIERMQVDDAVALSEVGTLTAHELRAALIPTYQLVPSNIL